MRGASNLATWKACAIVLILCCNLVAVRGIDDSISYEKGSDGAIPKPFNVDTISLGHEALFNKKSANINMKMKQFINSFWAKLGSVKRIHQDQENEKLSDGNADFIKAIEDMKLFPSDDSDGSNHVDLPSLEDALKSMLVDFAKSEIFQDGGSGAGEQDKTAASKENSAAGEPDETADQSNNNEEAEGHEEGYSDDDEMGHAYGHGDSGHSEQEILHHEETEVYTVLYPYVVLLIGVLVYYILSRYIHALPYTAVMFIIGFAIGFELQFGANSINTSATQWVYINGEVILLVFLPGLLFLDSYNVDTRLFLKSFWQLITFAFPMVLGGTALTACVAKFMFPYGWSFDLSMTFGAILSATDPVAVAVLLNELGAPPRLKMHISGESLLNDGAAVVFYNIFRERFFYEMGIDEVGKEIGWGEGFLLFFRLSLGGMCIGIAFGVGTVVVLYFLNRRLSGEDSAVQVILTVTSAYLTFFVSEILAHCSGIIAVMFCGLIVKGLGEPMINDTELMHHYWEITEAILNTLLFTLGGLVWGDIIANNRATSVFESPFEGQDWGYLLLLYVMLLAIRYFLIIIFYPIISNIGIGTSWKEATFMGWDGLRGAVGIALALSLNSEINHFTAAHEVDDEIRKQYQEYTAKLFIMVGGIAFLTLTINGTTSGPLLRKLGLVTPTETRLKVIENYHEHMITNTLYEYVCLLADERFKDVDYTVIKAHVSCLRGITLDQLMAAVEKHRESTPATMYTAPNLKNVVPYLLHITHEDSGTSTDPISEDVASYIDEKSVKKNRRSSVQAMRSVGTHRTRTVFDLTAEVEENKVYEERLIFIKLLRSAYYKQIEHGFLDSRDYISHTLLQSLDMEEDRAARGLAMNDWETLHVVSASLSRPAEYVREKAFYLMGCMGSKKMPLSMELFMVRMQVQQALAFIQAHKRAAEIFKKEFTSTRQQTLSTIEKTILDESMAQVEQADKVLLLLNEADVKMIKSHYACQVLLNRSADYISKLSKHGLMTGKEAGEFHEEIEKELHSLVGCCEFCHDDEINDSAKVGRLSQLPEDMLRNMKLEGVTLSGEVQTDESVLA